MGIEQRRSGRMGARPGSRLPELQRGSSSSRRSEARLERAAGCRPPLPGGRSESSSAEVAEGVRAQDLVFQNCSEGVLLPADLKPGSNALLAADRRYQV